MSYSVKEVYYTLQGEGAQAGRPAVFCRFAGCNLWSGREADRADAVCRFCDTDFVGTDGPGGGTFATAAELASAIARLWPDDAGASPSSLVGGAPQAAGPYVVFPGGEPLLQLDRALVDAAHARGLAVGVETNGTRPAPAGLDWVCVSPKAGTSLVLRSGDELKLVHPQRGADPAVYESLVFRYFFLQPMDGPLRAEHPAAAARYCLHHPRWRLSLQTHKLVGLP
jgi:7-carboxy-7-deazaguanine synthase